MARRGPPVLAGVGVVLLMAACAGRPVPGRVSGVLEYIGGPAIVRDGKAQAPVPVPHAGMVEFTPLAGVPVRRVSTGADGRFWISLPAGVYQVTGNPEQHKFWCVGGDITIKSGGHDRVSVDCPVL